MAGEGHRNRRGGMRLFTLCAVLLGLFFMHGAPASAAGGCHGATSAGSMAEPHDLVAVPPADAVDAMATHSAVTPTSTRAAAHQASEVTGAHGTTCVATPVRDRTPLPTGSLPALVAVPAAALLGRPVFLGPTGRRGPPPPGGRSLLLQVGVART
ncbi:hypothetical protein [Streptomyces sp. M41(2017)]|uniref:hypothetical protein n=1 Tax=Streptomyces sp. M41(2017) TaxID=1955065 RepID=UPI001F4D539E|nr:hypothetical protein [Streptomyces sp. M41(2017)]